MWQAIAGLCALGAALFLLDRVLLWVEARGWIYWRKRKSMTSIGTEFLQEITPGAQAQKHALQQERVRKNIRPAEEPPFHVDLDANLVRIRHPDRPAP
ncbi:hypothetical protein GCM10010387_40220 [Streptomyces inusitatus]|uniref:Uncharacterized protein n=1 Tax=Streptomyces inusitatus TaxID=68221 RepID=A0A918QE20_9ACTN|nr:hypothetical protein GCM10010387_40220 [Streptomyces inusitatus]